MNIAISDTGLRIKPFPNGKAKCQLCNAVLIAKCGEIYIWHWAHHAEFNCDTWKEHETEWHRTWKNKFPIEWQEVVMKNEDGEIHVADVKTPNGVVIEFQNSSISTTTIKIREAFYGTMVWVVNAEKFDDNFKIASVVKTHLRNLERINKENSFSYTNAYDQQLKELEQEIKRIDWSYSNTEASLNSNASNTLIRARQLQKVDEIANSVFKCWLNDSAIEEDNLYFILNAFSSLRWDVKGKQKAISERKVEIKKAEQNLATIEALPNISIDGLPYKLAPYNELSPKNYEQFVAVVRKSMNEMFLQTRKFVSEADFLSYGYRQKDFAFAVNPANAIKHLRRRIAELAESNLSDEAALSAVLPDVKSGIERALKSDLDKLKSELDGINKRRAELCENRLLKEYRWTQIKNALELDAEEYRQQVRIETERKKSHIMTKKRGLYTYEWKNERTSWRSAERALYFDFGEGFLFNKIGEHTFRKISYQDFIRSISVAS